MAFRAKWSGLIVGLYRSSFIFLLFLCLKHRHQNACHEIEQFGPNRCFYGYEFLFCSNQA